MIEEDKKPSQKDLWYKIVFIALKNHLVPLILDLMYHLIRSVSENEQN